MPDRVLVLGGGIGGIVASTILKRTLGPDAKVTVIDKNDRHHFAASFGLLMIGKRQPEDITRDLKELQGKGIEFIKTEVLGLDLSKREVATGRGKLGYDYLIISLGVEFHPEAVPGFSKYAFNVYEFEDVVMLSKELANFKRGEIVLFVSSLPYRCPPAPYEMVFLLDQYFRQRGNRDAVGLTLVTPEPVPESLAGPLVSQSVRRMLASRDIDLRMGAKVLELEDDALILDQGVRIPGDLFLGIAPHWGPSVLRVTDLVDESGWVNVDHSTLKTKYPEVYAIGDNAAIRLPVLGVYAPKAGVFAHYQAEVVARNIARVIRGQEPNFRYTGKGM